MPRSITPRRWRRGAACVVLACGGMLMGGAGTATSSVRTGLQQGVVFTDYSPLSRSEELARRLLTPLALQQLQRYRAQHNTPAMLEQPIDLAQETFVVHVPAGAPPTQGYGLLVFVPPWPQAKLPPGWAGPLDRHDLIFVSAANSGNAADVLDRRVPLALLAYENMRQRYRLDPARIYVGGFSGGSRVALHIALAYPDVFRGALLEAGSDPLGEPPVSLPPAALFQQFQQTTRLVYLTGGQDVFHLQRDQVSRQSLHDWCVFDVATESVPWLGHEIADAAALQRALDALLQPTVVDPGRLARCRAHYQQALAAQLVEVETALSHGERKRARARLEAIDRRYGGLAAAAVLKLEAALDAQL